MMSPNLVFGCNKRDDEDSNKRQKLRKATYFP